MRNLIAAGKPAVPHGRAGLFGRNAYVDFDSER